MTSSPPQPHRHLHQLANLCAGLTLFIAPFRATAGIRGGLLLIAAALIVAAARGGNRLSLKPPYPALCWAALAWIISVFIWSAFGAEPRQSLASWRGDVLTPCLAFLVFYALTPDRQALHRWIVILFIGLFILTGMIVVDPFQPDNAQHAPAYGTVGLLSTWLITLAPLLPLAWHAPQRMRRATRPLAVCAMLCLIVAGWLTANRIIWVCGAVMMLIYALPWLREPSLHAKRRLFATAVGLGLMLALFYAAAAYRVQHYPQIQQGPVAFMLQDSRSGIWKNAVEMIAEHPLMGYGYASTTLPDAFAARFQDPWQQSVFRHAHNVVLDYTLQMGIIGGAVILALFAALAWAFLQCVQNRGIARLAGICGLMLVAGVFLRNMVDDFFMRHTLLLFAAIAGMLLGVATTNVSRVWRKSALPSV